MTNKKTEDGHATLSRRPCTRTGGPVIVVERATLVWEYSSGRYLATDNTDSKNDYGVGALGISNTLHVGGENVYLPFTTVGGSPVIGDVVWMAAVQDDAYTGRGKATATVPNPSVPSIAPYGCQQIVPIGFCSGPEDSVGSRYFRVTLSSTPWGPIPNIAPADATLTTGGVKFTGAAYPNGPYFEADGTPAQMRLKDGETFVFTYDNERVTTDFAAPCGFWNTKTTAPQAGWEIYFPNRAGNVQLYNDVDNTVVAMVGAIPGISRIAVTNIGGLFRATLNGQPVVTLASAGADPAAATTFRIWYAYGAVTAIVKLARPMSDLELKAAAFPDVTQGLNPWAPQPSLIADLTCQWYLDLTTYAGGTPHAQAGHAGVAFDFTVVNGPGPQPPEIKTWTIDWHNSPASLLQSTRTPKYDQKHAMQTDTFAYLEFTVATQTEIGRLFVGMVAEDSDDTDESWSVLFVKSPTSDWLPLGVSYSSPNGTEQYESPVLMRAGYDPSPWAALGGGPYTVRFVAPERVWRQLTVGGATFLSGPNPKTFGIPSTATIVDSATATRLVVVADGITIGGHSVNLIAGSPVSSAVLSRMRHVYPGKITGLTFAELTMISIVTWGNGSVVPFAHYVADRAQEGAPATRLYYVGLGLEDWARSTAPLSTVKVQLAAFLDALHGIDPGAPIYFPQIVQTQVGPNLQGDTLVDYKAANVVIASTRPWLTFVDVSVPNAITFVGDPGNVIYPDVTTGQQALADNIQIALGY